MDERKLAELFRAAAADAPPATFDEQDVRTRSHRIAARNRSLLAGGSALCGVVLVAGLVFGLGGFGHTGSGASSVEAGAPMTATPTSRSAGGMAGPVLVTPKKDGNNDFSAVTPMQGGSTAGGTGGETGSARSGCGPADQQLASALAGELRSAGATAPAVAAPTLTCPTGARAAAYQVHDGPVTGVLGAVLLTTPSAAPRETLALPATSKVVTANPSAGGQLVVFSEPSEGATPPYADRLQTIANDLAGQHF